jgi:hypothetical protein
MNQIEHGRLHTHSGGTDFSSAAGNRNKCHVPYLRQSWRVKFYGVIFKRHISGSHQLVIKQPVRAWKKAGLGGLTPKTVPTKER